MQVGEVEDGVCYREGVGDGDLPVLEKGEGWDGVVVCSAGCGTGGWLVGVEEGIVVVYATDWSAELV